MKIKLNRIVLFLLITGAFWYRLFTAGNGIIGHSYLYSFFVIFVFCSIFMISKWNKKFIYLVKKNTIIKVTIICYFVFLIYSVITLFWAIDKWSALLGIWNYLITALLLIEIPVITEGEADILFICKICFFNAMLTSLLALYECFSGNLIFGYTSSESVKTWEYMGMHSPIVQYNHPNNLSCALILSYPFCVLISKKNVFYKVLLYLFTIAIFIIMIASDSRLSIIIFLLYFILSKLIDTKKWKKLLWLTLVILGISFLFFLYMDEINTVFHIGTGEARPMIWKNAFNNFLESTGFGVGIGNSFVANAASAFADYIGRPCHNLFLEVLEETGILGFIFWMTWFLLLFKYTVKTFKYNKNEFNKKSYIFILLFLPMTVQQSTMLGSMTIWMLFGVVTAIIINEKHSNKELIGGI